MRVLRLAASSRVSFRSFNPSTFRLHLDVSQRHNVMAGGERHSSSISSLKATPWPVSGHEAANGKQSAEASVSSKQTAYIALGSNLGDRIEWIEKACNEMDARGIKVTKTSSLWETKPMYVLDQNEFINGVCEVRSTSLTSSNFSNP